jgi:hypothetical protein
MVAIAKLALYGWIPFVLLVFSVLPARRAVIFAYVGGWLYLPMLSIKLVGIPDLNKITAASFGILLGASLFDGRTLLRFRPHWYDLPMALWCLSPFVTSLVNQLGVYDGVSSVIQQLGVWGIPYFVGRVYFKDLEGFKELGIGIIIGAVSYLPMCYAEMVISPTLHQKLYGYVQHSLAQSKRWGGFRPMVFMQSGLALAMFMTTATLVAGWMWASGSVRKLFGVPMLLVVLVLGFTQVVVCKTVAATGFLILGGVALYWVKWLRSMPGLIAGLPLLGLAALPPAYMYLRSNGALDRDQVIGFAMQLTTEERLQSLDTRLKAEDKVVERAFEAPNPWWGWGKWDPNDPAKTPWRVYSEYLKSGEDGMEVRVLRDSAPTDGLWIIILGQFGIVAIALLSLTISLPALILWRRVPLRYWAHPAVAPVAAMSVLLLLHMVDNLLNGMINSLFMLALGGVSAIGPAVRQVHRRYGPLAAQAVLDQQLAPAALPGRGGFPVQGGYPSQPGFAVQPGMAYAPAYAAGPAYAAAAAQPQQAAYPAMAGFPAIAGLQPGTVGMPPGEATGRRRR